MNEPWENLEAEVRSMPLDPPSPEVHARILKQIGVLPQAPSHRLRLRHWALAAAACLALGLALWLPRLLQRHSPRQGGTPGLVLASGWHILPTGDASYRILAPDRIRLDRGELYLKSPLPQGDVLRSPRGSTPTTPPTLHIETPTAAATATPERSELYIATHTENVSSPKGPPILKPFTRILILSGLATLTNVSGTASGGPGHLLAAEPDKAPLDLAIASNSGFATDLYARLARENPGKNLFFSPYSTSTVLAMLAEGARGETAAQMGAVLRFPAAAQRIGDDAQLIPWNVSLIHTGLAALSDRLADRAPSPATQDRIAALRQELAQSNEQVEKLNKTDHWQQARAQSNKSFQLAHELDGLLARINPYELRAANALWAEKTEPLNPDYVQTLNRFYRVGGAFPLNFRTDAEGARRQINAWVGEQTHQRIPELLAPRQVDERTRLVVTNAVYFKGEWAEPFAAGSTVEAPFDTGAAKPLVPMMHKDQMRQVRYGAFKGDGAFFRTPEQISTDRKADPRTLYPDKAGFAIAEFPYKSGDLSMVVIVPRDPRGLPRIEKLVTDAALARWIGQLQSRSVNVDLPHFKLEAGYDLSRTLSFMGMSRAFTRPDPQGGGAQFDGMVNTHDFQHRPWIDVVVHKAFIEVNEKGAEASAATAASVPMPVALPPTVPFTPEFRADRPFLFLIRDTRTGTLLFLGRLVDPR